MKIRTIILAKAPLAGFAKTRLIPAIGAEAAARLASLMLQHAITEALAAGIGRVELCTTPAFSDAAWQNRSWPASLMLSDQGTGDLGERLLRASQRAHAEGDAVLLMGTDCPALDAIELQHVADELLHKDAVIIPTADGGYALLGFKNFHPSLFQGISWSTSTVARDTLRRIKALSWTLGQRPVLHDIDEADDLQWLPPSWKELSLFSN